MQQRPHTTRGPATLSARRAAFVDAYTDPTSAGFGNATRAAILAGYSKRTARQQGQRLLTNVDIAEAVAARRAEAAHRAALSREDFILRALELAHAWLDSNGNPALEPVLYKAQPVVWEGKVLMRRCRPNMANLRALELAAKAAGLLADRGA